MKFQERIGKQFVKNNKGISSLIIVLIVSTLFSASLFACFQFYNMAQTNIDTTPNKLTAYNLAWNKYSELINSDYKEITSQSRSQSDDDELDIEIVIHGDVNKDEFIIAEINIYDKNSNSKLYSISERINAENSLYGGNTAESGNFITPNGLEYKWGIIKDVEYKSGNQYTVYFPKEFKNKCLNVITNPMIENINIGRYNTNIFVYSYDKEKIIFQVSSFGYNPKGNIVWRAIGY